MRVEFQKSQGRLPGKPSRRILASSVFHKCGRLIVILTVLVAATIQWADSSAMDLKVNIQELVHAGDLVFVGTLTNKTARLNDAGSVVLTDMVFDDVEVLHAGPGALQAGAPLIRLTQAGGSYGEESMWFSCSPNLEQGQRYLLFIEDKGTNPVSPILGSDQGVFRIIRDPATQVDYVVKRDGIPVVGWQGYDPMLGPHPVVEIKDSVVVKSAKRPSMAGIAYESSPTCGSKDDGVAPMRADPTLSPELPLTLKQFTDGVLRAVHSPYGGRAFPEPESTGRFYSRRNGALEVMEIPLTSADRLGRGGSEEERIHDGGTSMIPRPGESAQDAEGADKTMGACGIQNLNIVMQQVPESWWSFPILNDSMWMWNQFMDMYRFIDSDGTYGQNGTNEFCGWVDNSSLQAVYGLTWPITAIGLTQGSYSGGGCPTITESDIMWNPAHNWTSDPEYAINNMNVVLLQRVAMHELGHSWGYMNEYDGYGYPETYNYNVPTVMHRYSSQVVESGRGIHAADAYLVRRHYDDQTSVINYKDVGVESYYAAGSLFVSHTANGSLQDTFEPGEPISFVNVTVENMSFAPVSDLRVRFFLSTNRIISESDYQVGGYWYWSSFSKEAYNTSTYDSHVPHGIPGGQYYVGVKVTVDGYGNDDFTGNNTTTFTYPITITEPAKLNVTPSNIGLGSGEAGGPYSSSFSVQNTGGSDLEASIGESLSWVSWVTPSSFTLSPGQIRVVEFGGDYPGQEGPFSGSLTVNSNAGQRSVGVTGTVNSVSGVSDPVLPARFEYLGNFPNPFNPRTIFVFDLPAGASVDALIYDLKGRLVRTLAQGLHKDAGRHRLGWDGKDDAGSAVAGGVYLIRLRAGDWRAASRLTLLK